jgi:outer membrane protein assembly factor BamB
MRTRHAIAVAALLTGLAAGCSKGSSALHCEYTNKAALSPSTWPKFRHDFENTGAIANVDLTAGTAQPAWVYPPPNQPPRGPFSASPVLNSAGSIVYIGSTDGALLGINTDGTLNSTLLTLPSPITNPVLVGVRAGTDAIFVGGGNGFVYDVDASGAIPPHQAWPFPTNAFITGGPALSNIDGTVYAAASNGFIAICPNGIQRFTYVFQQLQSPVAVGPDGTAYVGSNDAQLRAIIPNGKFDWSFATSGPILAAPVVDAQSNTTYVADTAGGVFKVDSNGQPDPNFTIAKVGSVQASPALANDVLYVPAVEGAMGTLYAIDANLGGDPIWQYPVDAPIFSSPAVALSAENVPVIVFGADDGNLYFVRDNGPAGPETVQVCQLGTNFQCAPAPLASLGPKIESSPAIGVTTDAITVYVGANDGRVYAVSQPASGSAAAQ